MDVVMISRDDAEALRGKHGKFSALDPVATPDGRAMLPKRCLDDPDLASVTDLINTATEEENVIEDLPAFGEPCVAGRLYKYVDETGTIDENDSGLVQCVQDHNRTEHKPMDIPALFSFFRTNADDLEWIQNEFVEPGWFRMYNGTQYEVIAAAAFMTIEGQTPDLVPALWSAVIVGVQPWVQPTGAHDTYSIGDQVTHNGFTWESTVDNNSWEPGVYGWVQI